MASICRKCLGLSFSLRSSNSFNPLWSQVRWSRYAPIYLDPTFRKEDLAEKLDETDPRRYQPIKAAKNEQTSLVTYDDLIGKFTRVLMREGNRQRARNIVSRTMENLKLMQLEKYHKAQTDIERELVELDPKKIFMQAIENCKPLLILQRVKRGGVMYQVPIPARPNYQVFKAMNWLIQSADEKDRSVRVWDKLPYELLEAYNNEGKSVRKKQDLHRMCEANRAYAHFRW